jgi:large subunit ribosomal protein L1
MAGKKFKAAVAQVDLAKLHSLSDALELVKKVAFAKFDETVELTMVLGVDPRKADQLVRGTIVLPHGLGKNKKVAVIASGDKMKEALEAGADEVGAEDLVEKIKGGYTDFDALIATPDMMRLVGALGKVLGPRGLMPNPKTGTVTADVATAIRETKAGSFSSDKLIENTKSLIDAVVKAKPTTAKGKYVKKINVASTMGPGVLVDAGSVGA